MSPFDVRRPGSEGSAPSSGSTTPTDSPSSMPEPVSEPEIVLYGTPWCGDCRRARRVFAALNVAYRYVDIEQDEEATELVMQLNGGMRSVPTIIFPEGDSLVEPPNAVLTARLVPYVAR